ncbi:hypothetical protein [Streptomyces sp. NPDC056308]|uniref:hypothetical protein n=1 Tax=Streptomyces sp. NPDC056308 TaxID=3345780 RepID=UPI0035D9F606
MTNHAGNPDHDTNRTGRGKPVLQLDGPLLRWRSVLSSGSTSSSVASLMETR